MKNKYYERQKLIAAELIQKLEESVFSGKALDKELQNITRENRGWGSKDRRFYSEITYSFFRWYNFIKTALTETDSFYTDAVDLCNELMTLGSFDKIYSFFKDNYPNKEFELKALLPEGFEKIYDGDLEEFAKAQQIKPAVWLRCRDNKSWKSVIDELNKQDNLRFEVSKQNKLSIKVTSRFNINSLKSFREGKVEIQDFASQCIGLVANPQEKEKWMDVCAGAGGKTLQLAAMMRGKGLITSCDIRKKPLQELMKRANKAGFKGIRTITTDLAKPSKKLDDALFDGVLVDAPCSNSGTWRRNPDLKLRFKTADSEKAAKLQLSILNNAAKFVKPGGTLVYSTCSASVLENQQVVEEFLKSHADFKGVEFSHPTTGKTIDTALCLPFDLADNDSMLVAKMSRKQE